MCIFNEPFEEGKKENFKSLSSTDVMKSILIILKIVYNSTVSKSI
jgi:hypothetical protein